MPPTCICSIRMVGRSSRPEPAVHKQRLPDPFDGAPSLGRSGCLCRFPTRSPLIRTGLSDFGLARQSWRHRSGCGFSDFSPGRNSAEIEKRSTMAVDSCWRWRLYTPHERGRLAAGDEEVCFCACPWRNSREPRKRHSDGAGATSEGCHDIAYAVSVL